ncbi:MAG: CDGSH iron-sulfur domain-containing protein [Gammaproteobacteria bacterium]|nr:MAG: CDGSH iron-sulfur domain-containing protein [Gammaproteobacteria bacterium]
MSEPVVAKRGPCVVELEEGKEYWWCACGRSRNQPFCDGSHEGTGIQPVQFVEDQGGKRGLCCCKHTRNPPYCDGSHNDLPE